MIDDAELARRLARAICADIQLYNESKIREAAPAEASRILDEAVSEGHQLYVTRVTPALASIFEQIAIEMYERLQVPFHGIRAAHPPMMREPVMREPVARMHPPVPARPAASGVPPMLVVLIAIACAIGGAAAFFVLGR